MHILLIQISSANCASISVGGVEPSTNYTIRITPVSNGIVISLHQFVNQK